MYLHTVNFKLKKSQSYKENTQILGMFFQHWVDETTTKYNIEINDWKKLETLRVDFEFQEDATVIKLKGVPPEFRDYIELM